MSTGRHTPPLSAHRPADDAIICFARGTLILTPLGERRIEHLSQGDLVVTLDHGPQPVRWIGSRSVPASGALAPVRFARGAIGNDRDLLVSPRHRMLLRGVPAPGVSGRDDLLVPALALVDDFRVTVAYGGIARYYHMLFDRHQVIVANGAPSESFHPGGAALATLDGRAREMLFDVFPRLRSDPGSYGAASRTCLGVGEARALLAG